MMEHVPGGSPALDTLNANGDCMLHMAVMQEELAVLEALVAKGAGLDTKNQASRQYRFCA